MVLVEGGHNDVNIYSRQDMRHGGLLIILDTRDCFRSFSQRLTSTSQRYLQAIKECDKLFTGYQSVRIDFHIVCVDVRSICGETNERRRKQIIQVINKMVNVYCRKFVKNNSNHVSQNHSGNVRDGFGRSS